MRAYYFIATLFICIIFNLFCKAQSGNIYTFAGTGTAGFSGDGGLATAAKLKQPSDIFKDASGNFYIADNGNNRIRMVNPAGIITTIVGTGTAGYTGDGGPALSATLREPNRVWVDGAGNIYIADKGNNVIRMVASSTGIITTIAGTGAAGFSGDGGPAISAKLSDPTGVAVDLSGNIFISDHGNNRIRKINTSGIISTYAGGGGPGFTIDGVSATSVSLCGQNYVSVDNAGTVYLTNWSCWHFLRVTTAGLIYNVAGYMSPSYSGDCGPADSADIHFPFGICPDNLGNVYVCPQGNIRVRKVNTLNYITTVAGNGVAGYTGDGGPATSATVSSTINGIYADILGNIYFADQGNNVIRNFTSSTYTDTISTCPGGIDTVTGPTGVAGTWSSSNTIVATVGSTSGIVTGVSGGTAIVTFNNTVCPELFFVRIDTLPVMIGGTICAGATLTVSSGTAGGTWSSNNTSVATVGTSSGIVTGMGAGTAIITYTITGGCFTTTTVTITGPTPILGGLTLCAGATITLSDVTSGGTWNSGAPGIAAIDPVTGVVTGIAAGTATISYATGSGCFASAIITVEPLPGSAPITGPSSLCAGATITLSDAVAGGVWSSGGTSIATVSAIGVVTGVSAGTVTISYVVTNLCGTATVAYIITVYPTPLPIAGSTVLCAGATITLSDAVSGGTWSSVLPGIATIGPGSGVVTGIATGTAVISYVTVAGCATAIIITVEPLPGSAPITGPSSLCLGAMITLADAVPGGVWSSGAAGIATISVSGVVTGISAGTVTISYDVTNSCGTATVIDVITVEPLDSMFLRKDTSVCAVVGSITLNGPPGYSSYLWSTGSTASFVTVSATGVYIDYAATGCNTLVDSINITFIPMPVVSLGNDTSFCAGHSIILSSVQDAGSAYLWNTGSTAPNITVSATGTYWLQVTNSFGCSAADSISITVYPMPFINLGPDTILCSDEEFTISSGNVLALWNTGVTATSITVRDSGTYWASVSNSCGTAADTINVGFEPCNILLPSAFSPNGDGANDVLYARGYGIMTFDMRVYNRFGELVFESNDINIGWDGKFKGQNQPIDVYACVVNVVYTDGLKKMIKRNVTLLK